MILQGAEDFRQAKRQKTGTTRTEEPPGTKKRGLAFGTGALEDTDTFGYMDDYISNDRHSLAAFSYEVASDDEGTDLPGRYGLLISTCLAMMDTEAVLCMMGRLRIAAPAWRVQAHLMLACSVL